MNEPENNKNNEKTLFLRYLSGLNRIFLKYQMLKELIFMILSYDF